MLSQIQIQKYKIIVSESTFAWAHGLNEELIEYFIPELEMCINKKGGIFISDKSRCQAAGDVLETRVLLDKTLINKFEEAKKAHVLVQANTENLKTKEHELLKWLGE